VVFKIIKKYYINYIKTYHYKKFKNITSKILFYTTLLSLLTSELCRNKNFRPPYRHCPTKPTLPVLTVPPGIVTRKSEIYSRISPRKGNIFQKYFGVLHRGLGTIDSCKKPDIKNLMLQSL
jgi:hypothetical protein